MLHARSDYDAIQPWPTKRPHHARIGGTVILDLNPDRAEDDNLSPIIPDNEPVFLIRGHDPLAYDLCIDYANRAELIGCAPELVAAIRRHAELIREWAEKHPHNPADAPKGTLR